MLRGGRGGSREFGLRGARGNAKLYPGGEGFCPIPRVIPERAVGGSAEHPLLVRVECAAAKFAHAAMRFAALCSRVGI